MKLKYSGKSFWPERKKKDEKSFANSTFARNNFLKKKGLFTFSLLSLSPLPIWNNQKRVNSWGTLLHIDKNWKLVELFFSVSNFKSNMVGHLVVENIEFLKANGVLEGKSDIQSKWSFRLRKVCRELCDAVLQNFMFPSIQHSR